MYYHWKWTERESIGPMLYGYSQYQVTAGYMSSRDCGFYGDILYNGAYGYEPDVGSRLSKEP